MACMCIQKALLTIVMAQILSMASCQQGYATVDHDWGHKWYMDEPFRMYCNSTSLLVTSLDRVTWTTPSDVSLAAPYNDTDYELKEWFGVEGYELFVKRIHASTQGVYVCSVFDKISGTMQGRGIIGLNVHEPKYADMYDKYRDNVVRAFIASGTFFGAMVCTCLVYHCRYKPEQTGSTTGAARNGRQKSPGDQAKGYDGPYTDLSVKETNETEMVRL